LATLSGQQDLNLRPLDPQRHVQQHLSLHVRSIARSEQSAGVTEPTPEQADPRTRDPEFAYATAGMHLQPDEIKDE
jgi:hypothetical protein